MCNLEKEGRVQRLLIHNISPCISAKVEPGMNMFESRDEFGVLSHTEKEKSHINDPPIIELLRKDILPGSWKLLDLVLSHVLA